MESVIGTELTKLLKVPHPVILAGMAVVSSPPLAAAVSNAGGLGVIGAGFPDPSPKLLKKMIDELKSMLHDKTAFGVDLLIPQVGGNARKTNKDYMKGKSSEMIDIICESGCRLFVCAVGVPPTWMVDKLHAANILCMNMVGSPKHVPKALQQGVDIICAQGYEAGGHTGEIATMVLIPQVVDACRGHNSPLTGGPVHVVAAGGIYNGRTLAASMALGAEAVWVGTRFLASEEATATKLHKDKLIEATADDTLRSALFTGRPARFFKTTYVKDWEITRKADLEHLIANGKIPWEEDVRVAKENGWTNLQNKFKFGETQGISFSQSVGAIRSIEPAATIVRDMVQEAATVLKSGAARCRL